MTSITSYALRLAALTVFVALPAQASAQAPPPSSILTVRAAVPAGGVVDVSDTYGRTITGVLGSVTVEAVEVIVNGQTRAVFAPDIQRIRWRKQDSWLSGALIGAGIGAIPGVYYLMSDPNECAGPCPEEYGLVAVGALVGALVDKAITKKITVFAGANGTTANLALSSVLAGARRSVLVTVQFRHRQRRQHPQSTEGEP